MHFPRDPKGHLAFDWHTCQSNYTGVIHGQTLIFLALKLLQDYGQPS